MTYVPYFDLKKMNTLNKQGCNWFKEKGKSDSEVDRVCIAKTTPKSCEESNANLDAYASGCKAGATKLFTKAKQGPVPYDELYMALELKTRKCAGPSWPPRLLNGTCGRYQPMI